MPSRFSVIIPVYNHEQTVARVAREALELGLPVFVVDDGSTDGTLAQVRQVAGVRILRHGENRGKGAAILTGFQAAEHEADWALTIDADGQHSPSDARRLISAIPEGSRPIIVGRREGMTKPASVPWTSRFGREFSNFWVRAAGGPPLRDSQSGLRLYPLPEALELGVTARRFQFEVEILAKARWFGVPVLEVPVSVTYPKGRARISHYRPLVDFSRNAATFTRLILTRLFILPFCSARPRRAT